MIWLALLLVWTIGMVVGFTVCAVLSANAIARERHPTNRQ